MSDLGSHWNDLPWWALKLDAPKTIESFGPDPHPEIAPASLTAVYEYGPRGDMPPCKLVWYQGVHKPQIWKEARIPQWPNGVLFIGSKGRMLLSDYQKHVLLPEAEYKDYKRPEPTIPESPGHQQEWLAAIKNGTPTGSPFGTYAGPLTEANHLGNVAYRAGMKIVWDAANMRVRAAGRLEAGSDGVKPTSTISPGVDGRLFKVQSSRFIPSPQPSPKGRGGFELGTLN
jgi:hypothetical protein